MSGRVPPHDVGVEDALLGAVLLSTEARVIAADLVAPEDFYEPKHGHAFEAAMDLWQRGETVDRVTVADWLRARGIDVDAERLAEIVERTPSTTGVATYATVVARHALSRRLIGVGGSLVEDAYVSAEPEVVLDHYRDTLADIATPTGRVPEDLSSAEGYLDASTGPEADLRSAWVIPGLLRHRWRVLMVAAEGVGKTWLLRQIALLAAQGVHPFAFNPIPRVRTLLIDLENPADHIVASFQALVGRLAANHVEVQPGRTWIWHRERGVDLRSPSGRTELAAVMDEVRPDVVCVGPLYKAYRVEARERNEELAAGEVQNTLDRLRAQYGFALLIEHHAPKTHNGSRPMEPHGTGLWLRWPEIGLTLKQTDERTLTVGRFRPPRVIHSWPTTLRRGTRYPWEGVWPTGTFPGTEF